jgi:hypothetical protein
LCVARCPAPRRRADPPSLESRPSSRVGRFAGAAAVIAARAPLPCSCVVPLFGVCRRAPVCRWHPQAEHATVEPRPCLSLAWSRVSTNPCRAHVVGVVPSPRLCRRHFTRTHQHRVEALFFLVEPCMRTHTHARSFTGVCPQPTPPGRSSPFSLSLFPCLVHAINFVSLPWPSRRRSARTRTPQPRDRAPCFTCL